jgi:probable HAF family extracellular repeat protein
VFFWEKGDMQRIPDFGGPISFHYALNNRGQVVGQSDLPGGSYAHPFLWDKKKGITDLGVLPGGLSASAHWINDAGEIVGGSGIQNDTAFRAVLWENGVMADLGTVDGDPCGVAESINSKGQIVGGTCNNAAVFLHAFLWEKGGPMVDLNTLIPSGSGLTLTLAVSINDRGEIAGQATTSDGNNHAFLLIPCDENDPGEGCDDAPGNAATAPQAQSAVRQSPGPVSLPIPTRRASRYHQIAPAPNSGNNLADDVLVGVTSPNPRPVPQGYCLINTGNNTLTGECIALSAGFCSFQQDNTQCPPRQKARAPTNFSCQPHQVARVDGARPCQTH